MELAVRRFARNILIIHVALLILVLGALFLASRGIYSSAQQTLEQAESRQQILANQTAAGIANSYRSILSVMDLVPHQDEPGEEQQFLFSAMRVPNFLRNSKPADRPTMLGVLLTRQLEGRISHLFIVEKDNLHTRNIQFAAPEEGEAPATRPAGRPGDGPPGRDRPDRPGGLGGGSNRPPGPPAFFRAVAGEGPSTDEVAKVFGDFLKSVDSQAISPFQVVGDVGMNLVCLPINKGRSVVVAAVPVRQINAEFLGALSRDESTGVYLFDESLKFMASSRRHLVGTALAKEQDQQVRKVLNDFSAKQFNGSLVVPNYSNLGGEQFDPGILTAAPIEVLPGTQWKLVIGTPLAEVDRVVGELYRRIFLWALVFAAAVTAILVSTSLQMIRSRAKYERERHVILTRELDQARQIQLAWLPQKPPVRWEIDVAAVNRPANHISGDFYNWFDLPDGRTAVVIGDVTGHGMSAAFLMATAQLLVRNTLPLLRDAGRCLEEVNRQLCVQVFNGQFVTMQILVFDPEARTVEIATAGHPAPLLRGADGAFTAMKLEPQLVLGVEEENEIPTERFELPPDASLLLYTDGVTDLQSPDGKRLLLDGLTRRVSKDSTSAQDLLDAVMGTLDVFRGRRELGDDLTIVAIRFQPQPAETRLEAAAV